jgi:hypothetical protein
VTLAVKAAAKVLGYTAIVCCKYYIHPAVLTAYTDGDLFRAMKEAEAAPADGLNADETAVRELLWRTSAREEREQYGSLLVNDARVVQCDIPAANGVIHLIDRLLIPHLPRPDGWGRRVRIIVHAAISLWFYASMMIQAPAPAASNTCAAGEKP